MIFQIAALFARAYLETRLVENGEPREFAHDLSYLVVPPILIVFMFPVLRQSAPALLNSLCRSDLTLRLILASVLLGFALRTSYWGILLSFVSFGFLQSSDPSVSGNPQIVFGCPTAGVLALSFFVMALLVPVIEEVINRGLILQNLLGRGRLFAVAVSSVLFAVLHDPESMTPAFCVGLFLGIQALNYQTLWAPVITHATYNAVGILDWECITTRWSPADVTSTMIGVGLLATALAAVGLTLSCLLVQKGIIGARKAPR